MRLIDSHCHIHDSHFFPDTREEVYVRAAQSGIGMIVVGTDEKSSIETVDFSSNHDGVWATVGVHPHEAKNGYSKIEGLVKSARGERASKLVGVGEIGLDYYYMHSSREEQIKVLETQIQLALDSNLPISFHIRDSFDDFWPIFDNFHGIRGVMHSFTDNQLNLEKGFERGLFVGVNGISTFTRDKAQAELYKNIPLERMLLETDAPFLTPTPFRGTMNEPKYIERVAEYMAEVRGISPIDVAAATLANTIKLFRLPV